MATLGEILSGIVGDVLQARSLADLLARETRMSYMADPFLSAFPIPRIGIKDISIKLRFAVDAVVEKTLREEAKTEARELWKVELATKILQRVAPSGTNAATLKTASDILVRAETPEFGLSEALKGNVALMVRESTSFLAAEILKLPVELRRQLGNVRVAVTRELPAALEAFLLRVRQLVNAKAGARTDLRILVCKADLEKVPEQTIHEFTFTLILDEVHVIGTGVTDPPLGG